MEDSKHIKNNILLKNFLPKKCTNLKENLAGGSPLLILVFLNLGNLRYKDFNSQNSLANMVFWLVIVRIECQNKWDLDLFLLGFS